MEFSTTLIVFLVLAYLLGAIPFGVIVSRYVAKKDVRAHGSGNIGATNVSRLMGKKWGLLVLFLDAFKGFLVVFLAQYAGLGSNDLNAVGLAAVVGHCFPIFLGFKGGKGVATSLGVLLSLSPFATLACLFTFLAILIITRIISASSLASGVTLIFMGIMGVWGIQAWMAVALTILIWWKHKENIVRLTQGKEPRFF